jgi:hypothetical protein
LEHVGQMSAVELVVEVLGGLLEVPIHIRMQGKGGFDDGLNFSLDRTLKFGEVPCEVSLVDDRKRALIWHTNSKKPEVSLESWVDSERTSSWVHGSDKLRVLNFLHQEFVLIIPMLVVSVLSEESNSGLGIIRISCWHVQVIDEVDELACSLWSKHLTSFLLKVLFQHKLKGISISVEVEIDNLLKIDWVFGAKIVQKTLDNLGLTSSWHTNQDSAVLYVDELVHQE